ncbi:MAG: glycine cleavage system aminomethyltransferase GcvT [Candidatus Nanopelagicales bacterium]
MTQTDAAALRRTPLYDRHVALGAKTADFGGWDMPIEYAGGGVVAEHTAVRTAVGLFDVSHMGKVRVHGPGARDFLNGLLANDLGRIGPGQAQYTMLCDGSGGVLDDLIVYLVADDELMIVPNASNAAAVLAVLREEAPDGVEVQDLHTDLGIIAVQGPSSAALLDAMGLPTSQDYMAFASTEWGGGPISVCRTGYTGEHGYELIVDSDRLGAAWDDLLALGRPYGVRAAGLGARDTLRTEMGYPLHGQDLSLQISPVQARLGWAVGWGKPSFRGREALVAEKEAGPRRRSWGLRAVGRGIPRPHMAVRAPGSDEDPLGGAFLGEVTSGTFSPTLRTGIGLALLDPSVAEGDEVVVDVRGRPERFAVVKPPFVRPSTR